MQTIKKPWGKEEILVVEKQYVLKRLHMNKGHRCSLQYHKEKTETIYVLSGVLSLCVERDIIIMKPGDFITIQPMEVHRMVGIKDTIYLESSTAEFDDVVRVEDSYGRK